GASGGGRGGDGAGEPPLEGGRVEPFRVQVVEDADGGEQAGAHELLLAGAYAGHDEQPGAEGQRLAHGVVPAHRDDGRGAAHEGLGVLDVGADGEVGAVGGDLGDAADVVGGHLRAGDEDAVVAGRHGAADEGLGEVG